MKLPHRSCSNRTRTAVAAVEFAVVAPLLLLLVFMMIESSRYLTSLHATTGAAREAVRLTAIAGASLTDATAQARDVMSRSGFKTETVVVNITSAPATTPGMIVHTATVTISFSDVSVIGDPFDLGVSEVNGFSTMLVPE